jgi:hypothetical protein
MKKINWNDWNIEEKDDIVIFNDEIFSNFLKDNNAYDKFIYNLEHYSFSKIKFDKLDNIKKLDYLDVFYWKNTKEGVGYWDNLNDEWEEFIT